MFLLRPLVAFRNALLDVSYILFPSRFINLGITLGYLKQFRSVWIFGRMGGGKTALAFGLAYELLKSNYSRHLLSNCRCVWADDVQTLEIPNPYDSGIVAVIDEGGLFLETSRDVKSLLAFLRKLGLIVLVPSVRKPALRLQELRIQRLVALNSLGVPLWIYKTTLSSGDIRENSYFFWWRPNIFGVYDTLDTPQSDRGIIRYFTELARRVSTDDDVFRHPGVEDESSDDIDFSPLTEAAEMQIEAAAVMSRSASRHKKSLFERMFG